MIDLRRLRDDPDYRRGIERKRVRTGLIDEVLAADDARRALLAEVEELRARQNAASKEIGQAGPDERPAKIAAASALKDELAAREPAFADAERALRSLALALPNPAAPGVPDGGEDDGVVLRVVGEQRGAPGLDHADLAEALGFVDAVHGAEASGSRFAYLQREAVLLELALVQWTMGRLVEEGFVPTVPPVLVRERTMEEAGFFPTDRQQVYELPEDELFLVGTSEVPLSALHRDEILAATDLPLRYAGFSTCFRREAGTYGKDTRGIFRVHQFDKVEMFAFVAPEQAADEHDRLLAIEESIVDALGLPYRVVDIAAGDLGAAAARKLDLEVWLPSEGRYRELTSCSTYGDFSARRLQTRVRGDDGTRLAHTLNGTACAVGRTLVFLCEHYQDEGAFVVPDVLRPHVPFTRVEPARARLRERVVATRLVSIGIDSHDPVALGEWWAEAIGWAASVPRPGELELTSPVEPAAFSLLFLPVDDAKREKNRVHLDLASSTTADQRAGVDRLVRLGAQHADIGQDGTPWVVLADPEGNELCVLDPRARYAGVRSGDVAAVVLDAQDPEGLAAFWAAATGWTVAHRAAGVVSLHRPGDRPPDLDIVAVDRPKQAKLRWHLDVMPVETVPVEVEADRLRALGAVDVDIGQHDDPQTDWIVLADPEGNELCVVPFE